MAVFGADSIARVEYELLQERLREAIWISSDRVADLREALACFSESAAEPVAHLVRLTEQVASWNAHMAEIFAPIARWNEQMTEMLKPVARLSEHLVEVLEPFLEGQRVAQTILELGLLPNAEMIELVTDMGLPEGAISEVSEWIALDFWPKLRPQLELSLEECLGDQKLFVSFSELVHAHDHGFYQLTIPSAASVIERAVRSAQRHGQKVSKPMRWLDANLRELPCTHVRSWRVLSIVMEQTFAQCWTDAEADTIRFPNRHAAAHGLGAKLHGVVDSLNAVLLAHFVITAALAFEKHTRAGLH
ncbi:MAG: hypothetical protein WBD95_09125 [Xanthobacteraceae bacterium]